MSIQSTVLTTQAANILVGGGGLGTATTTVYLCNKTSSNLTVNLLSWISHLTASFIPLR